MSFFKSLFKEVGTKDVITLFHKPALPASVRALTILKQARATAVAHATEDQASSHSTQSKAERTEFELDVQEAAPTSDQVRSILEFLGASKAGEVVEGAKDENDAIKMVDKLRYPIVVDWNKGKAVVGDNESEILKLVKEIPKETSSV